MLSSAVTPAVSEGAHASSSFDAIASVKSLLRSYQQRPRSSEDYFYARWRGDTVLVNRTVADEQEAAASSGARWSNMTHGEDVASYLRSTASSSYLASLAELGVLEDGSALSDLLLQSSQDAYRQQRHQAGPRPVPSSVEAGGSYHRSVEEASEAFLSEQGTVGLAKHRIRLAKLRAYVRTLGELPNETFVVAMRTPVVPTALVMHRPMFPQR